MRILLFAGPLSHRRLRQISQAFRAANTKAMINRLSSERQPHRHHPRHRR